jgi:hypothetical protein
LEQRVDQAEQIVYARLNHKLVYESKTGQRLYTLYVFDVQAYLKQPGTHTQVALIADGGQLGDFLQVTHPNFYVSEGQEAILFLQAFDEGEAYPDYQVAYPDLLQCRPYAGVQGVVKYQQGRFFDIGSQAHYGPQEMLDTLKALTGFEGVRTDGSPFVLKAKSQVPVTGRMMGITSLVDGAGGTGPFVAGTDEVSNELIINGSGFGNAAGSVLFPNADDGGNTAWLAPFFPSDLLSWTDTQIRIKIPEGAGTGTLSVRDTSNTTVGSAQINILYGVNNIYTTFNNFPEETVFLPKLSDQNGQGGYTFVYNNTFPSSAASMANNTAAQAAFERAINTWQCNSGVNFSVGGSTTSIDITARDGVNVVTFADNTGIALGVANMYYLGTGNNNCELEDTRWYLEEMDIRFNSSTDWNFGPSASANPQFDFESVALHEIGHTHGLAHVIDGTDTQVMHHSILVGTDIRSLSTSELAGSSYLAAEGTATPPCLATSPPPMTATSGTACTPLPVELLHFHAHRQGERAILEWATATELNNDYFTLEHSTDGRQYKVLDKIAGAGTTQQPQQYQYQDGQPAPGINYYRLWQTDYDGQKTMIGERSLRFPMQEGSLWVTQPVQSGQLELVYESTTATGIAKLQLLDVQGRLVWNHEASYSGGRLTMSEDLPNLPSGMYVIQLQDGRRLLYQRLVI